MRGETATRRTKAHNSEENLGRVTAGHNDPILVGMNGRTGVISPSKTPLFPHLSGYLYCFFVS